MPRATYPSCLALTLIAGACAPAPELTPEPELEFTLVEGSWEEQAPPLDPTASCIHEGQLRRPLWWTSELQMWMQQPGEQPVQLSGDFSTLWPRRVGFGPAHIAVSRVGDLSLFDRETGVRAHRWEFVDHAAGNLYVDARGSVVAELYADNFLGDDIIGGRLFELEGETELPDFLPRGPVDARGLIPGLFLASAPEGPTPSGWGWVDPLAPLDHETHRIYELPASAEPLDPSEWPRFEEGFIEYVDAGHEEGPRFVRANSSGGVYIELPGDAASYRRLSAAPGYRLLELDEPSGLALLDVNAGSAELVSFGPAPEGASRLSDACVEPVAALDQRGRLLSILRLDNVDRLAAWDLESQTWTLLGAPMARANHYRLDLRGEWILAGAEVFGDSECPAALSNASDVFEFDSAQVVHPDTEAYFWAGEHAGSVRIDPQGVCLSWESEGVQLFDLRDWETGSLPDSTLWGWL